MNLIKFLGKNLKVCLPYYNPFHTYVYRILFRAKLNTNRTLQCTHTYVISFTPLSKVSFSMRRLQQNSHSIHFCEHLLYRISSRSWKNVEIKDKILFTPSNSVWFSPRRFSLTPQPLNGIAGKYLVWNFIKIDGEILKVQSWVKF
jgi:hypothetical protein